MIRILHLEDNPTDAALIEAMLRRSRVDAAVTHVSGENAFRRELVSEPDVILADLKLPTFDGMSALRIARDVVPDVPFIVVSGVIDDEVTEEALRNGATDYIQKDRAARLPQAIERAVAELEAHRAWRRVQESLRTSEQRFYLAAEATRDVIWDCDVVNGTVIMNDAVREIWGYDLPDPVDREWWLSRIHPDDSERVRETVENCIASRNCLRWESEYRFRRADGPYGVVFDRGMIVRGRDGTALRMIGAMQDVTERAEALSALSEAQRVAHLGSWSYDPESETFTLSEEAARIFGSASSTLSLDEFLSFFEPADREDARRCLTDLDAPVEAEKRIVRPDGATRAIQCRIERSHLNERVVGTVQDVTERRRLEQQVEQERRVSSLGRVTATMAHEFNNVLMAIQPFAEIIKRRAGDDKTVQNAVASIAGALQRGRNVAGDILRMTHPGQPVLRTIDLVPFLQAAARELSTSLPSRVKVEVRVQETPLFADVDQFQMQQVLTNLALNAADAMPAGGTLTICAERVNGSIEIAVADTGEGIAPENLGRVFEPLFTTKRTGTGLGLAVVSQLVVLNHGTVSVESRVGEGTVFRIVLPARG